jgi:DNA-binding protein H-NS
VLNKLGQLRDLRREMDDIEAALQKELSAANEEIKVLEADLRKHKKQAAQTQKDLDGLGNSTEEPTSKKLKDSKPDKSKKRFLQDEDEDEDSDHKKKSSKNFR